MNILCLHGSRTNAQFLRDIQMRILRQRIKTLGINLHFLNGSIITNIPANASIESLMAPPYYEWFRYTDNKYYKLEESLELIQKNIKKNNINGILGFSQGACIASLAITKFPKDLKYGIFICGVQFKDANHMAKINVPSYHMIGKYDTCIEQSHLLANQFKYSNTIIDEFSYGHIFPKRKRDYDGLYEFIRLIKVDYTTK